MLAGDKYIQEMRSKVYNLKRFTYAENISHDVKPAFRTDWALMRLP